MNLIIIWIYEDLIVLKEKLDIWILILFLVKYRNEKYVKIDFNPELLK